MNRSQSEPTRASEPASGAHTTPRSSSIAFAPLPVQDAYHRRESDGTIQLEVATIGSVTRHLAELATTYQGAGVHLRATAKREMIRHGSGMFADYILRHAHVDPNDLWALKGPGGSSREALEGAHTRAPTLDSLNALCDTQKQVVASLQEKVLFDGKRALTEDEVQLGDLSACQSVVLAGAEARRSLMAFDVRWSQETFFQLHGVQHTPAMQGVLVGCILEGAAHALETSDKHTHIPVLSTVVALCNAMEHFVTQRKPMPWLVTRAWSWLTSDDASRIFWSKALAPHSLAVVEKCASELVSHPNIFKTEGAKAEFAAALRETVSFEVGHGADHALQEKHERLRQSDYALHGPAALLGGG